MNCLIMFDVWVSRKTEKNCHDMLLHLCGLVLSDAAHVGFTLSLKSLAHLGDWS
jgi:hypothetical protein